ncbi:hypothetical protein [Kribbella catacumbae]|uniref:hypothetical protein n=1 Tax=Kribbella catacumbae TaxID=460086 RepID=UPI000371200D|nr:hypothetical protein [Kribbella catacumbae]
MPEPKEKDFVGIDPVSLKAMNDDLANAKALINTHLPSLRKAFWKADVATTPIDRLIAIGKWIDHELPMLQRRQALAAQLQKEGLQQGLTPAMVSGEWPGNFPSTEAATARAKELAARYTSAGKLPPEVWAELAQNQHDPDFAEAFAKAIGPDAANLLAAATGNPKAWSGKDDPEAAGRYSTLANVFATASHRGVIDGGWLQRFPGVIDLMRQGTWDNKLLIHVGDLALNSNQLLSGNNQRTAQILAIIARSPIAAADVYSANFDKIQQMIRGQLPGWSDTSNANLGDPLAAFITSATVDASERYEGLRPDGVTSWPNPAEELTRRLLLDLKTNPQRTPFTGVMGAYTAIATEYYDDLRASVGGPPVPECFNDSDPARPGVEAPASAWSVLVQQAMWDPKNAAVLSTYFGTKDAEYSKGIAARETSRYRDANNFTAFQNGQVTGWFLDQLNIVKTAASKEVDDYNAQVKQWVDYIVDPANAAAFAKGGLMASAAAAGNAITGIVKSAGVQAVKDLAISWFDREPPVYVTDTKWATMSADWQFKAGQSLTNHRVVPVTDAQGTTWSGDPAHYEKMYGGKFMGGKDDPLFLPVKDMSPAARRAFAAWLQDPAVQDATWSDFGAGQLGKLGK